MARVVVGVGSAAIGCLFLVFAIDFALYALFGVHGFFASDMDACARTRIGVGGAGFCAIGVGFGLLSAYLFRILPTMARVGVGCLLLAVVLVLGHGNVQVSFRFAIAAGGVASLVATDPTREGRAEYVLTVAAGLVALGVAGFITASELLPC